MERANTHAHAAPSTGTTIVACTYAGGVVLGADGRVSVGNYISNRASNKIAPLADNVFLLRSGSAPDAQMVSDYGEQAARHAGCPGRAVAPAHLLCAHFAFNGVTGCIAGPGSGWALTPGPERWCTDLGMSTALNTAPPHSIFGPALPFTAPVQ